MCQLLIRLYHLSYMTRYVVHFNGRNLIMFVKNSYSSPGHKQIGISYPQKDVLEASLTNGWSRIHRICLSSSWNQPKETSFSCRSLETPVVIIPLWTNFILKISDKYKLHTCILKLRFRVCLRRENRNKSKRGSFHVCKERIERYVRVAGLCPLPLSSCTYIFA